LLVPGSDVFLKMMGFSFFGFPDSFFHALATPLLLGLLKHFHKKKAPFWDI
jgi:hypothetical protein